MKCSNPISLAILGGLVITQLVLGLRTHTQCLMYAVTFKNHGVCPQVTVLVWFKGSNSAGGSVFVSLSLSRSLHIPMQFVSYADINICLYDTSMCM